MNLPRQKQMQTNSTPDERQVTQPQHPSAAVDSPMPRADRPSDVPGPTPDDRTAIEQGTQHTSFLGQAIPPDFDFEPEQDPRQEPAVMSADDNGTPPEPAPEASPTDRLQVRYNGQVREYDRRDAEIMLSQYLNNQSMGPVVAYAKELARQRGVQDPRELVKIIDAGIQNVQKTGQVDQQAMAQQAQTSSGQGAFESQPRPQGPDPMTMAPASAPSEAEARATVEEFFRANNLKPTQAMFNAMLNMARFGAVSAAAGQVLPAIIQDVSAMKQQYQQQAAAAQQDAVAAMADRVATELGINDAQTGQAFEAWMAETEQTFPGFRTAVSQDPAAMERAVRTFAAVREGMNYRQIKQRTESQNRSDAARATGDMIGARPSAGQVGGAPQPDFNRDMMDRL